MNDDFENELRQMLRPVEAPDGFAERVMRALPAKPAPATVTVLASRRAPPPRVSLPVWRRFGAPVALAASLLVSVMLGQHVAIERAERADEAGRAASRELMQALRVTSQKLDLAYQAVKSPPQAASEENRS
jgi:hypothetical protein